MIGVEVGECRLGPARARHALAELLVMAGFPRAEGPPAVTVSYGRDLPEAGSRVVVPSESEHVPREAPPEAWRDGDVDVPVLFRAEPPRGETLLGTVSGSPLLVRAGGKVYLGFDVAAAADYYLNGRGEVGWPRDRYDRVDLRGAPAWRQESLGVAVVNRYAGLLARAAEAAAETAGVPLLRFRYWPAAAPIAMALSHDVDRLRSPGRREILRSWLRLRRGGARARYPLRDFFRGVFTYEPLEALAEAEAAAGGVSTFFVGARRRGPLDFAYEAAEAAEVLRAVSAGGREVALHASFYSRGDGAALVEERETLAAVAGEEVVGVRGHYLGLAGEEGWGAVAAAGFAYDASAGFPSRPGWRAGAALPYRPFDGAADRPYDFVEIPLAVMDGTLFQYQRLGEEEALAATRAVLAEAISCGGLAPLLWHYRAFPGGAFPSWGEVYRRAVADLAEQGGVPLRHRGVASRYHLLRGLAVRRLTAAGAYEILAPGDGGDVLFEAPAGWRASGVEMRLVSPRTFSLPPGVSAAAVTLTRER
jgi:hypothetical protein